MLQLLTEFDALEFDTDAGDDVPSVSVIDDRQLLLKKVCAEHYLLDLRFAHGPEAYQTAILELVPEAGYLVLDAMLPTDGDAYTADQPTIKVRTRINGIDLKFQSIISQRGVLDGTPFYKVPYPETIDYRQRRQEYRVTVPLDIGVNVRVHARDGTIVVGEVRDLSPNGFSAPIPIGDPSIFEDEDLRVGACEIDLPRYGALTAAIDICHVFPRRGRAVPRLGVRFLDLDPRSERRIERCVAGLDRQQNRLR